MRVHEVLKLPPLKGARVLAGSEALDREVTGVNIIEVPDVRRWLRGGEFLFTSGYAWRTVPEELSDLICDLHEVGVVALGLKPGPYLLQVPPSAITTADRLGLPLIRIPAKVAYMDVIEPIFHSLASQRLSMLERTFGMSETLAGLGLDEQSMEALVGALADQIANPVYVFDDGETSVVVGHPGKVARRKPLIKLSDALRALGSEEAPSTPLRQPVLIPLAEMRALRVPLVIARQHKGYVIVLEEDSSFDDFAEFAIRHVAEVISFLMMKRMGVIEGRREAATLFFDSLLSDRLSSEDASEQAVTLGLRLSSPHVAILLGVTDRSAPPKILADFVDEAFSGRPHAVGWHTAGREVLVLVEVPSEPDDDSIPRALARIQELASKHTTSEVLAGSGSASSGRDGIRQSLSEAAIAYRTARRLRRGGLVRFEELGVERLLAQIPDTELAQEYVARVLGPLESHPQLLKTLEAYLEHGGNKVAAAAAVPLHRSSLVYRLRQVSRLLDTDIADPDRFLELWLAVRLRGVLKEMRGPGPKVI